MGGAQEILSTVQLQGQIEVILGYSKILFEMIEERTLKWNHRQCIADVFLALYNYLKVYTQYLKDYSIFCPLLNQAKENKTFRELLKVFILIILFIYLLFFILFNIYFNYLFYLLFYLFNLFNFILFKIYLIYIIYFYLIIIIIIIIIVIIVIIDNIIYIILIY